MEWTNPFRLSLFLLLLLVRKSQLPLTNTEERLIFLLPDLLVHLLVELGRHLCTKENKEFKKKKKKEKKEVEGGTVLDTKTTYVSSLPDQER